MALDSLPVWLEAAPKALVYAAILLAAGACGVRWLVLPRAADLGAEAIDGCDRRLARLLATAVAILAIGLGLRLLAHTFAVFGAREWQSIESIRVIALESRWGAGWRLQMLCAGVALPAALLINAHAYIGWPTATIAVIASCLAVPLLGHAAGSASRIAFHAAHVLGAGLWIGTLAAIVIVGRPRATLLERFTPVALAGASLVTLAGSVLAFEYVTMLSDLWSTAYGRALSIKLAVFSGVVVCGYFNWRRWRAGESTVTSPGSPAESSWRIAAVETFLALGVVLVTALLTELEHP